jgi:hypothetical protein
MNERPNLLQLYKDCAKLTQKVIEILGEPIQSEAKALLRAGFMVPDSEVFEHPKIVFQNLQKMTIGFGTPTEYDDTSLARRLDFICAIAGSIEGFSSEYDLVWSNVWRAYIEGEGKNTFESARLILHSWNAGKKAELMAQLKIDCKEDHDDWVHER